VSASQQRWKERGRIPLWGNQHQPRINNLERDTHEFENKNDNYVYLGKQPLRLLGRRRSKTPPSSLNLKLERPELLFTSTMQK
jgi:hypothetical protein